MRTWKDLASIIAHPPSIISIHAVNYAAAMSPKYNNLWCIHCDVIDGHLCMTLLVNVSRMLFHHAAGLQLDGQPAGPRDPQLQGRACQESSGAAMCGEHAFAAYVF